MARTAAIPVRMVVMHPTPPRPIVTVLVAEPLVSTTVIVVGPADTTVDMAPVHRVAIAPVPVLPAISVLVPAPV